MTGTNDAPVITEVEGTTVIAGAVDEIAEDDEGASEGDPLQAQGVITFSDVDLSDAPEAEITSSTVVAGNTTLANGYALTPAQSAALLGAFSIVNGTTEAGGKVGVTSFDNDGTSGTAGDGTVSWSYDISDADIDFLGAGDSVELQFEVSITDGNGGSTTETVTITVTGTNDAPVITEVEGTTVIAGAVDEIAEDDEGASEGDPLQAQGVITFSDVDLSDQPTVSVTPPVKADTLEASTGDVTTSLANGYELTDEQHDALVAAFSVETTEGWTDGVTTFDNDGTSETAGDGTVAWSYDLSDADIDFLGENDVVVLKFDVTISDGNGGSTTETVTITVTGTNDAPAITEVEGTTVIAGAVDEIAEDDEGASEGDPLQAQGVITFSDVDLSDAPEAEITSSTVVAGNTTLANGYALTPAQSAALLGAFSIVNGTTEAGGKVGVTSFDNDGTSGTAGDGTVSWSYDISDADIDFLGAGDSVELQFEVSITDGNGGSTTETVTITVTGTNDAPVVAAEDVTGAVIELEVTPVGNLTDTGTISFTDVDLTDSHSIDQENIVASDGALGTLTASVTTQTDTTTGAGGVITWNYSVAASAVEYLAQDETKVETFTITLNDGNGGLIERTISVTVTGTNDAPVISVEDPATQFEGDTGTPAGQTLDLATLVTASDVDNGEMPEIDPSSVQVVTAEGSDVTDAGLITINTDGTLSYDLADFDFLGASEAATFEISFNVVSGTDTVPQTITLTINGENDDPVAVADTGLTDENSPLIIDLLANDTDVDTSDTLTITAINGTAVVAGGTVELSPGGATVKLNADGTVTYDPNGEFDALVSGASATDSFTYTIEDISGASSTATVEVDILGDDQFDFVIGDFNGFSGNSIAKVLPQFDQANGAVELKISALPGENSSVNSNANSLGVSSDISNDRQINSDPSNPEGLTFKFESVSDDPVPVRSAMPASSFSLKVFSKTTGQSIGYVTLLVTVAGVVDPSGVDVTPQLTEDDFVVPTGVGVIDLGNNTFIVTGLSNNESFTIDTTEDTGFVFNQVNVENGAEELTADTTDAPLTTYGGDSFTLGLLGVDFPQYVGGSAAGEALTGTNLDDTIVGFDGDDVLMGLYGNDLLIGGDGNDTLIGGAGADVLRGGADSDTFVLDDTLFSGVDTIEDYLAAGLEQDQVDLTALVDVAGGSLSNFVQYNSGTGILEVDTDGLEGSAVFTEVAVIYADASLGTHPGTINILYDDGGSEQTATI